MFIGRYYHRLEEKGRISLPKVFRQKSSKWIVTRGLDGGLFLFKPDTFEQQIEHLNLSTFTKKQHRDFTRLMTNDAKLVNTDQNGRVTLPDYLIKLADLNKEVVVVGSYNYLEIWSVEKYHEYLDRVGKQAEQISESLDANAHSSTS